MSENSSYILDANVFIEAKNRYYAFDICPGFWSSLISLHSEKRVFSIDRIRTELAEKDDELKDWIDNQIPETFFKKTEDQAVVEMFQRMVNWVYSEDQFTPAAKNEFASVADGWVMAFAAVNKSLVVTHEEYAPDVKKKVPMPNVGLEFEVECLNTFDLLRTLDEKLIRSTKRRSRRSC